MDFDRLTMDFDDDFDDERLTMDFDDDFDDERVTLDFDDEIDDSPTSDNFSVPIDKSVLDRLPDLDDFDDADCDSEAEYSYGDDSLSLNDDDDSIFSEDEGGYACSLYTIMEETEEDLSSFDEDEDDDSMNDELDLDYRIQMPRSVSLDAYLAKDERRHQANNLDVTYHPTHEDTSENDDESDCMNVQPTFLQRVESGCSFASQDDDDIKSVDSSSTAGSVISFRLAQRKLQKELSFIKLKQAFEAAELSSSFRKDDARTSKCIDTMERTLLKSTEDLQARANLPSASPSSKMVSLTVQKE